MATAVDRRALVAENAAPTEMRTISGSKKKARWPSESPGVVNPARPSRPGAEARQPGAGFGTPKRDKPSYSLSTYGIPDTSSTGLNASGGSSGGAAATAGGVAIPGAVDPAFLAYLRQFGIDESDINVLAGVQTGALERELARALPAYAEQRKDVIRDTGANYESRGFYRSGNRVDQQAENARDVDRDMQDYQARIYDQIREIQLNAAMDIAALRRQLMEQGLTYAQADALARAEMGL